MVLIIGGKLDGQESPLRVPTFEEKDEQYILIEWKEDDVRHYLYMLAGTVPIEAIKRYRVLNGFEKLKK
jgi:hypothetical protein